MIKKEGFILSVKDEKVIKLHIYKKNRRFNRRKMWVAENKAGIVGYVFILFLLVGICFIGYAQISTMTIPNPNIYHPYYPYTGYYPAP
jgi:hypothetical protein